MIVLGRRTTIYIKYLGNTSHSVWYAPYHSSGEISTYGNEKLTQNKIQAYLESAVRQEKNDGIVGAEPRAQIRQASCPICGWLGYSLTSLDQILIHVLLEVIDQVELFAIAWREGLSRVERLFAIAANGLEVILILGIHNTSVIVE